MGISHTTKRCSNSPCIILGVTGSIAAYKAPELVRAFKDVSCGVRVVMTDAAARFVSPLSLEVVSENPVVMDSFSDPLVHIELTRDAAFFLTAPASLNTITKFALPLADNLLTTMFTAYSGASAIAPAMNSKMYENPIFKRRLNFLKSMGVIEIPPESGSLACGDVGVGKMAAIETIVSTVMAHLNGKKDMAGMKVLVTAGPTREYIDPVRFLTNRSSGKMGYAVAYEAAKRGATVTLISGPVSLPVFNAGRVINVETSSEMEQAVLSEYKNSHIVVKAAAVSDFKPETYNSLKITRQDGFNLSLTKTHDILARIAKERAGKKTPFIVGFAAETGANVERAREKLIKKGADLIVFNDVTAEGAGFDVDSNIISIVTEEQVIDFPQMSKSLCAGKIFDAVLNKLTTGHNG
ncbi:bifunctional phosphopantothenoylcysteine decarboxylase/phosphopantothenate--cysteine ligase CoaBC [Candidatus Magnetomonas plexicatena]|uniref:bifunctional phosphopantothenoylcysteine decarboxylase/phosphopantothenate--cysteine ligase CoaBC n=1 Tax=Candidatus Magnetomonas plexicatena TaxID=2552947 RepID=UPI001C78E443|nr:bifunctional phosphopantothenoylcysteine decarboxylase/phosphopantothenate--cysteine ligase CoaBC [Nitrospirales bacterium LBB_01]